MKVVKYDLQDAVGTIQLCAGQDAGCEAAVHAMEQIFADNDTEAMILVNAFNCLNRQVTLLNCETVCPALSYILINTYGNNSQLFCRWTVHSMLTTWLLVQDWKDSESGGIFLWRLVRCMNTSQNLMVCI